MFFFVWILKRTEQTTKKSYGEAGAIAEESFASIKTVKSLNGEEFEIQRYTTKCKESERVAIRAGYCAGVFWGVFILCSLALFTFSFLIGSRLIADQYVNQNTGDLFTVGDVFTVFFAILTGIFFFGNVGPLQKSLETAKHAVASILDIIDRPNVETSGSFKPETIHGNIVFENVSFAYPSNPDQRVLQNLNLEIEPGQNVAIVGPSGSGKSTIVQLLERFYDPTEGRILLDGVDLKEYDLTFLRQNIGLVSQQPILFADTIKTNILIGFEKKFDNVNAEIWNALDLAQASDFVKTFDKGFNEFVGNQGGQLSGGQKQRIAIARALIRSPAILLLDEATSALDRTNEMEIQKTLDQIAQRQTTLTVAHRLTSVIGSHKIFVMMNGRLVEEGTHAELIEDTDSSYYRLFHSQVMQTPELLTSKNSSQQFIRPINHILEEPELEDSDEDLELNANIALSEQNACKAKLDYSQHQSSAIAENLDFINDSCCTNDQLCTDLKSKAVKLTRKNKVSFAHLIGYTWWAILLGLIFSGIQGSLMPIMGYLLGSVIDKLSLLAFFNNPQVTLPPNLSKQDVIFDIDMIIVGFAILGFTGFICSFLSYSIFGHVGEKFTFKLRTRYFRRLMYKDLDYFDNPENQPGDISSRLALDCKIINLIIGTYAGAIIQSLTSLATSLIIGFWFSWRITLVMLSLIPLLFISGIIESKVNSSDVTKNMLEGSDVLAESFNNMRVVRSLNAEKEMLERFSLQTNRHSSKIIRYAWMFSFLFGFSQFAVFLIYAIIFKVGAKFQVEFDLSSRDFFIALFCLMLGGYGAGMAGQFLSGVGEAQASARKIMQEFNTVSLIENDPENSDTCLNPGLKLKPDITGRIEFNDVKFTYSTRKGKVLNRLSLTIEPNQRSAFVGSSGSGKSTLIQLLLRFYDPQKGNIMIDGVDIKDIDIVYLRSIFGIVRQEPMLFNGSIEHNLKYNRADITEAEMKRACEDANAYDFIQNHPDGFSRDVGNRGEKLSGGQKQRIVIARVMARNPKILLFDEATSALDSQSESLVQKAIEQVSKERSSISVAHRISTIKECDSIYVMDKGKLVEQGSFSQLLEKKGKFAELALN